MLSSRLHVGNLEEHIGPDELRALFERAGRVISIEIVRDQATNRSKGYAFVEMATREEGARAITMLNGHHVNYRPLIVKRSREAGRGTYRSEPPRRKE